MGQQKPAVCCGSTEANQYLRSIVELTMANGTWGAVDFLVRHSLDVRRITTDSW